MTHFENHLTVKTLCGNDKCVQGQTPISNSKFGNHDLIFNMVVSTTGNIISLCIGLARKLTDGAQKDSSYMYRCNYGIFIHGKFNSSIGKHAFGFSKKGKVTLVVNCSEGSIKVIVNGVLQGFMV
jgi:hypothetical protein